MQQQTKSERENYGRELDVPKQVKKGNDDVLVFSVNVDVAQGETTPQYELETQKVEREVGKAHVEHVYPTASDTITVGGKTFDLFETLEPDFIFSISRTGPFPHYHSGIYRFVKSLGLDTPTTENVYRALSQAKDESGQGLAELAQLATLWAPGEKGENVPTRLLLSGHSGGTSIYGHLSWVAFSDVQALAKAMPKAAAQVEDVMLSACNCGDPNALDAWRSAFVNLKTLWRYGGTKRLPGAAQIAGKSPSGSEAATHISSWLKQTAGRATVLQWPGELQPGFRENATLWSIGGRLIQGVGGGF